MITLGKLIDVLTKIQKQHIADGTDYDAFVEFWTEDRMLDLDSITQSGIIYDITIHLKESPDYKEHDRCYYCGQKKELREYTHEITKGKYDTAYYCKDCWKVIKDAENKIN